MRIFVISPVRGIAESEVRAMATYVSALEEEHDVYWPLRDTPQDDPTGVEICRRNRQAIADCDEAWVWWNPDSAGSKFDLGIAWALHKPLRLIRQCVPTPHKSFENVMLHWQEHGPKEAIP